LDIDALVLECVYPTISEAVHNRVSARFGPLAHAMAPALLCQLYPRLGIFCSDLCPIDHVGKVDCPLMIAAGELDKYTTLAETQRMFEAACDPKELVVFENAGHVDLHAHHPRRYEEAILPFLASHLKAE
jgi:fermentation-respiration switch protein FrsA (DUF1100 family)